MGSIWLINLCCFSVYYSVTFAEYSLVGWSYPTCILLAGETCPLFGQRKYGRPILNQTNYAIGRIPQHVRDVSPCSNTRTRVSEVTVRFVTIDQSSLDHVCSISLLSSVYTWELNSATFQILRMEYWKARMLPTINAVGRHFSANGIKDFSSDEEIDRFLAKRHLWPKWPLQSRRTKLREFVKKYQEDIETAVARLTNASHKTKRRNSKHR